MAFRLTIIGGGPGGYSAAFRAAAAGAEVTLIERNRIGGTCLHCGCIPTKTLKASADAMELMHHLNSFGLQTDEIPLADMPAIIARKNKVSDLLSGGLVKTAAKFKVSLLSGTGRVISGKQVEFAAPDGQKSLIESDAVIIATGSRCLELPGLGFDHKQILSSDDVLSLESLPKRVIILGGGVIGCELAFIFHMFGAEVTVVEGQSRLLPIPGIDDDIAKLLTREMKKRGIEFYPSRTITQVEKKASGVVASLALSPQTSGNGTVPDMYIEADALFVTVGRGPNTDSLGLEEAGISTDKRGWIMVDERMRTSLPDVYAIGDILGPTRIMLAHTAIAEAQVAVDSCLGKQAALNYAVVPSAIFTAPEIGCVGLTETQAKEKGLDVTTATVQVRELGKAHASGELAGLYKLVAEKNSGKLLGAHLAGAHATEMLAEVTLAIQLGATAADLAATIHAHPTLSEGIWEAANIIAGH
ncbi:dihydrolipoyl dehydrogenase [Desulfovibrio sp. OttesenSCG-928-C06]|nr:dihydrolipoyl dehydrogenase [Desulfovibrio sp. OttesenSCG-928-C06]